MLTVLELLPVEVDVSEVEDGGDDAEDDILLLQGEAQHLATRKYTVKKVSDFPDSSRNVTNQCYCLGTGKSQSFFYSVAQQPFRDVVFLSPTFFGECPGNIQQQK